MSNTKKFYDYTIDGCFRIAVVESINEYGSEFYTHAVEINQNDLPSDFASWKIYDAFATLDHTIDIMSGNGE